MGILLWILFGAIAGWIASAIMKTNEGMLTNIILGIVGAMLGGWIMALLGVGGVNGLNFYSLAVAVLGAIVFIAILRSIRRTA